MILLRRLSKSYRSGPLDVPVLEDIDLDIAAGEFVALMGPSGSGKSTLLNVLGLLDSYDTGEYYLNGLLVRDLSETEAARQRGRLLGFVFQAFNLLPFKTALENVALPLYYQNVPRRQREAKALALLERLGLGARANHRPSELSGGQRQRVAIARALIADPPVILADEPTGNLDSASSAEVMELLMEIQRGGKTIIMVTHAPEIACYAERTIRLQDRRIAPDQGSQSAESQPWSATPACPPASESIYRRAANRR